MNANVDYSITIEDNGEKHHFIMSGNREHEPTTIEIYQYYTSCPLARKEIALAGGFKVTSIDMLD